MSLQPSRETSCRHCKILCEITILRWFLQQGANVNAQDGNGWTPLIVATVCGSMPCLEILLAQGADRSITDASGKTALDHARRGNRKEIAAVLKAQSESSPARSVPATLIPPTVTVPPTASPPAGSASVAQAQFDALKAQFDAKEAELQVAKAALAQKDAELQATKAELQATQTTLTAVSLELTQLRTASTDAQLQQTAQGLVGTGHRLTLDDICVLVQFWNLDIKLDALRASTLTLQDILDLKPVTLKRRLGCNYGTAVALVSFLLTMRSQTLCQTWSERFRIPMADNKLQAEITCCSGRNRCA
eukprot:m.591291 g.591291  ORF g.591291 m.591291 type:complete len:305 (+) comp58013_c0_seq52:117-1031(+)